MLGKSFDRDCAEIEPLIAAMLSSPLEAGDQQRVARHFQHCSQCVAIAAAMMVETGIRHEAAVESSVSLPVATAVDAIPNITPRVRRRLSRRPLVGAGLAMAAGLAVWWTAGSRHGASPHDGQAEGNAGPTGARVVPGPANLNRGESLRELNVPVVGRGSLTLRRPATGDSVYVGHDEEVVYLHSSKDRYVRGLGVDVPEIYTVDADHPRASRGTLRILGERNVPYSRLFSTVVWGRGSGYDSVEFLVETPVGVRALVPHLPMHSEARAAKDAGIVVSITERDYFVWLTSGQYGTLMEPLESGPNRDVGQLGARLVALHRDGALPEVIVQADGATRYQIVADVMATVPRGVNILLALGFPETPSRAKKPLRTSGRPASLDTQPDQVARTIRARYLGGIKRCHQAALEDDPGLGGEVTIRFTVDKLGAVFGATVTGFDSTVDACIRTLMRKWKFAVPTDSDGRPTTAEFQVPFILRPQ